MPRQPLQKKKRRESLSGGIQRVCREGYKKTEAVLPSTKDVAGCKRKRNISPSHRNASCVARVLREDMCHERKLSAEAITKIAEVRFAGWAMLKAWGAYLHLD